MVNKLLQAFVLAVSLIGSHAIADTMDRAQFQRYVMDYLNKATQDGGIKLETLDVGLPNIYRKYQNNKMTTSQLNKTLNGYFGKIIASLNNGKKPDSMNWDLAKIFVRPQIAPVEYLKKIGVTYKKLDTHIAEAYVVDNGSGYIYVTDKNLKSWKVDEDKLSDTAIKNLDNLSKDIPMKVSLENDKFIIVQVQDGYDAARILIPSFRRFVSIYLGDPFYAAIPNRDLLIMWSGENSNISKRFVRRKIKREFTEQLYPLSSTIFEVTRQKIRMAR